ncbi:MAG: phosphatase domain-containing protein, partial [Planctomycetota bacterium]
ELTGMGRIFTWDPHRPVIAVDIDHTIADTQRRELIGSTASDPSTPIPLAAPTLRELGQRFQILYLTSRPRFLLDKTRHWLRDHGFPEGPVFTAAGLFEMFGSRAYKQAKLAELRRAWPNLLIGIGDRASDAAAYQANGMLAINIGLEPSARLSAGTVRLRDWGDVREFFAEHYEHAGLAALRDGASVKATR